MKKITLLITLLTFSLGFAQSLPIDFESSQPFTADSGASVAAIADGGSQVLQIVGNGSQWDNAQVTFASVLDLSDSNNNTIKFRMKNATGSGTQEHLLKFEGGVGVGDIQVEFTTTGSDWQDIEVDMDGGTHLGSFAKMVIMVDWGGGTTSGTTATYLVDDISIGATTAGTDATLSDIKVDGTTITGFSAATTSYTYSVPSGTTVVPTVTATTTDGSANAVVTAAGSLPGNTTILVTAANGTTTSTYTISFTFPIEFPFDFTSSVQGFAADGGSTVTNGAGNDVLQIVGAANNDWDNAQVTFSTPVDLSDDANNTLSFTIQSTTAAADEVHQHGVSFQGGGGSIEANFQTTGPGVHNISLDFGSGLGSREKMIIFTDTGNFGVQSATGGQSGTPTGSLSGTYIIDNIALGANVAGTDATLSDIKVDGTTITGFDAATTSYTYAVPAGTMVVPTVTATTTDGSAAAVVTAAGSLPGDTTILVTAADNTTTSTYTISFGFPVEFPFDFNGSVQDFVANDGSVVSNGAGNDVLQIVGAVNDWDNAQVTFSTPLDLSDADNNTLRFTIQSTTAAANEVHQHGVSFQGGGGSIEANFQTVGTGVHNVELNFGSGLGSREKMLIFTDTGNLAVQAATGGQTGTPTGGLSGTYIIDNITFGADPAASWTGNVDSNWGDVGNWSSGSVPSEVTNVTIASGTITIGATTGANVNNLTVTGGALEIEAGGSLMVSGTATGNVIYKRNLTSKVGNQEGWHTITSPVVGQVYNDAFVTTNNIASGTGNNRGIATYNNNNVDWDYFQAGGSDTFGTAGGYIIKTTASGGISFTGTINTSDVAKALTVGTGNGFNLVGNPFPAYISSATLLTSNTALLASQTIWVWNQNTKVYEAKVTGDDFKVAPGQGFFVEASSAGNMNFATSIQSHETDTFLKSAGKSDVVLNVANGKNNKFAKIYYRDLATTGFDNGYDGKTFNGVKNDFAVFTRLVSNDTGENYQIQSLPTADIESMIIPVGLKAVANSEIIFSAEALNLPIGVKVFLEDRASNNITRIDNSNYKVTLDEGLDGIGRFYLHISQSVLSIDTNVLLDNISVYKADNATLRVVGLSNGKSTIKLFNLLGKQLINNSFDSNGVKEISLPNLSSGIYLVQVETEAGKLTKKIIIE